MAGLSVAEREGLEARARRSTPGGVHSNVRLPHAHYFFERGDGAWLWDTAGSGYVDYLLGQGPAFLGHANREVNAGVAAAVEGGMVFGAQRPLEVEAAEALLDQLEWPEMVRFGVSGTEVDQIAFRLARAVTGRTLIVRFLGHYHGWLDDVLTVVEGETVRTASAGQLPFREGAFVTLPWNDPAALTAFMRENGERVAAVVMEPMMCNNGGILPREGYLETARRLCDDSGALLIFDEVITGFRIGPRGAVGAFGVTPDLATYGKAVAGGWPVAALAGREEHMRRLAQDVNHSGTFNASAMASGAVTATMAVLRDDPPYARIEAHGTALMTAIRESAAKHGLPLWVQGTPAAFHVSVGATEQIWDLTELRRTDLARYARLAEHLAANGIWVAPRGIWYVSASHGERELAIATERIEKAFASAGYIFDE